jgi:hypothetical protein
MEPGLAQIGPKVGAIIAQSNVLSRCAAVRPTSTNKHGAAQRSRSTLDSHSDSRDEDTWGDKWVLNVYSCPNVESKQWHISAPCVRPSRIASRTVASGGQRTPLCGGTAVRAAAHSNARRRERGENLDNTA